METQSKVTKSGIPPQPVGRAVEVIGQIGSGGINASRRRSDFRCFHGLPGRSWMGTIGRR